MTPSHKKLLAAVLVLLGLVGVAVGYVLYAASTQYMRLIAVSWGGSAAYGPAFYRAEVLEEPRGKNDLQIRAQVYIDRPSLWLSAQHGPIELGRVPDHAQAIERWGQITWTPEGVRFGHGEQAVLVPRKELENHR